MPFHGTRRLLLSMSLTKAIQHGKERRKPYRGSKAWDRQCRNHGRCGYCLSDRTHRYRRQEPADVTDRRYLSISDDV